MVNYKNINIGVDYFYKKDIIMLNSLIKKISFMNKMNDSIPILWDAKNVIVGGLYEFPKPVNVPSLRIISTTNLEKSKKYNVEEGEERSFKTARLFQFNEELEKCFFSGHKVPEPGCKKSNRKYVFGISI